MLVNWVTLYKHITVDGFLRFLFLMRRRLKVEHQAKPRNLAIVQTFPPQKMQVRQHKNHSAPNSMKNDFFIIYLHAAYLLCLITEMQEIKEINAPLISRYN